MRATRSIRVRRTPFPHAVVRGLHDPYLLGAVLDEFPSSDHPRLDRYDGENERKLQGGQRFFRPATREFFRIMASMAPMLAERFELPTLEMELDGGGYHVIPEGGFLNIHTDFSQSPATGRYRRLNVLTYMNPGWFRTDGGALELWDDRQPVAVIDPQFNTTVMFVTSDHSWHGHPVPVAQGKIRRSLAAYFYSVEPPLDFVDQSTVWHPHAPKIGA